MVTPSGDAATQWALTDDLLTAGPEVQTPDLRNPPGLIVSSAKSPTVFALDAEAGVIRFGDGAHGARPPAGATLRVSYDYGAGLSGNVAAGAVNQAPALPSGLKVTNPIFSWGGADAESATTGEKEIPTYLQHRDRLVTATDFVTITCRTPGVDIGRVEVLPVFNPTLARQELGNAPGAVTLMIIPRYSATSPDAPVPDSTFLNTVCAWLEPRRLVTTELFLCGPEYVSIWVSVAIEMEAAGSDPNAPNSSAVVREAVKERIREFLLPFNEEGSGWPLRKTVLRLELEAEVARVDGVALVNGSLLASGDGAAVDSVAISGVQLPRLDGIEVTVDTDPLSLDQLRGTATTTIGAKKFVPVPVIPEEC
jgi:predicted phage baseplate assembly protein